MRKKITGLFLICCLLLAGCSKAPELLDPLGFEENAMTVKRGDMYNIRLTDNVAVRETMQIKVDTDAVIKSVNVSLGDEVKAGDVLFALDGGSVAAQAAQIDEQIDQMQRDHAYLDSLSEVNIATAQAELSKLQAQGAAAEEINAKQEEIVDLQNSYYQNKVKEEQELAELTLQKMNSGNQDADITAPSDGVIMYMGQMSTGNVSGGTVLAVLGLADSKVIEGEYIEEEEMNACDEYYALVDGKKYGITYDPPQGFQISNLTEETVLQNTYYINEGADEIPYGTPVNVVMITDRKENVLYIPDDGLYEDVDGTYVYVRDEEGKKVRKNVEAGTRWETAVEIVSGLEEGDIIYGK